MTVFDAFSLVPDSRAKGKILYPLQFLLLQSYCATLAGCSDFEEIEDYGFDYQEELQRIYEKLSGDTISLERMPSHDTINRLFQSIDPDAFFLVYKYWVGLVYEKLTGTVISLDGKTIRGIRKSENFTPAHIVSAFSGHQQYVLAQEKIATKGSEHKAFLNLLELLDLEGKIVTIDAAGTYNDIAETIVEKGGDYLLTVKLNQPHLLQFCENQFKHCSKGDISIHGTLDCGHGRVEERSLFCLSSFKKKYDAEEVLDKWIGLTTVAQIVRTTTQKASGKEQTEELYYITTLSDPKQILETIRSHWSIENNLHRTLDVLWGEDDSQKSLGNSAENFNILMKINSIVIKNLVEKEGKTAKRQKRRLNNASPNTIFNLTNHA